MYRFLGCFYSRTCGLFIPELMDFLFPNLWIFYSRTYGIFVPDDAPNVEFVPIHSLRLPIGITHTSSGRW